MYHLLKKLKKGQIVTGKVVKLKNRFNNIYIIEIFDQWITAKSPKPLNIGSMVEFIVEIVDGAQTLKIKDKKQQQMRSADREVKILRSCSLEINSKNLELISKYIELGKPIQLDSILRFFRENNGI
jgi:hypothetical protein